MNDGLICNHALYHKSCEKRTLLEPFTSWTAMLYICISGVLAMNVDSTLEEVPGSFTFGA